MRFIVAAVVALFALIGNPRTAATAEGLLTALDVISRSSPGVPAFFRTHPNPEDRAARLRAAIEEADPL